MTPNRDNYKTAPSQSKPKENAKVEIALTIPQKPPQPQAVKSSAPSSSVKPSKEDKKSQPQAAVKAPSSSVTPSKEEKGPL